MTYDVRPLEAADLPAAGEMSRIAFGGGARQPQAQPPVVRSGHRNWGAFDRAGRLVAKAVDRQQEHWFGGRLVPACGLAGVAVAPEVRASGLAGRLLNRVLEAARDRGAVICTLFPTTPGPYRRIGCEEVGALVWTALPTASLARTVRPAGVSLRPAEPADVPALLEIYRTVARTSAGLLERSGPLFDLTADAVLAGHDGITVAEPATGGIEGYASWDRGRGYDASGRLSVHDLMGLTAPATTALLGMLGSWASVAPTLHLRIADRDPARLLAPFARSTTHSRDPWMLRVIDAPAAFAARGWPDAVAGAAEVFIDDESCPWNHGPHRLVVEAGQGRLEPGGAGNVRLSARGLAVLYAGAVEVAVLRRAGLMSGSTAFDGLLQAATSGPPPTLLDYF